MSNINNILNSKLLELLAGVDKGKIEQVSKMVNNMSKDDLNNLLGMLGNNSNSTNRSASGDNTSNNNGQNT